MDNLSHLTMGERIRYLRLEKKKRTLKKYSLQELANRLGDISKQTLSQIERGKIKNPSASILNKIATEFGVTIDYLVSGIEGNKDNFLLSKNSLFNSVKRCREKMGNNYRAGSKNAFIYKKIENLLDLFDVIYNCLQFDVRDNYDLYTVNLNKLTRFIDNIAMFLEGDKIESGLEIIVDQAFWRLGKILREFAVRMDQHGDRNLYPEELARISEIVGDALEKFQSEKDVLQKVMEIDLQGARLSLAYYGFINIPEEYWLDFKKRIILEWEIIMQKVKRMT
ncbi:MAG: helix-turn-helix domain-containing protein [Bacillota bacterium]